MAQSADDRTGSQRFISDIETIRPRARQHMERGAVTPNYPEGRAHADRIAERIAIESYREMVRYFGDRDPTSRRMMEDILAAEEEHADDLVDLLQDIGPG